MNHRTIKFRAWDIRNSEWLSPTGIGFAIDGQVRYRGLATNWYALEQFTGLLDNKGKEIFEGDALLNSTGDMLGYVYFDDGAFRARWKYAKPRADQRPDFFCSGPLAQERCHEAEVIGNIHENPDLLTAPVEAAPTEQEA